MSEPVARPIVAEAPRPAPRAPGVDPAVWSHRPTLGNVSGERFRGRIVIEVYKAGADVAFIGTTLEAASTAAVFLKQQELPPVTSPMWPNQPIMATAAAGSDYLGRVVVELWDRTARLGASAVRSSIPELGRLALLALARFSR